MPATPRRRRQFEDTGVGESFVADCSRIDHLIDFDPDHLQLNLTIPHAVLEQTCRDWLGFVPGDALWQHKCRIGGRGSAWLALMEYLVRAIAEAPDRLAADRVGRHLEQTVCIHLLNEWAAQAGLDLDEPRRGVAPRHVRIAEHYMAEHAASLPSMTEGRPGGGRQPAQPDRGLQAFPRLHPQRLPARTPPAGGAPPAAGRAGSDMTVSRAAYALGYVNLGEFARSYRARFGERPSETLRP